MRMALTLLTIFGLLSCDFASAVTLTFQEGVDGYSGTSDTYLQSAAAFQSNVNGAAAVVSIDGVSGSDSTAGSREGLLQFSNILGTSANQIYPGSTILSATLRVFVSNSGGSAVGVHRVLQPWNETISYATSFGADGINTDGVEAFAAATGTLAMNTTNQYREVDVTADLAYFAANPSENYGWAFLQPIDNPGNFDSSENATLINRPELIVELIQFVPPPVPEPGSGVLCLAGLFALSRVNRKRNRR